MPEKRYLPMDCLRKQCPMDLLRSDRWKLESILTACQIEKKSICLWTAIIWGLKINLQFYNLHLQSTLWRAEEGDPMVFSQSSLTRMHHMGYIENCTCTWWQHIWVLFVTWNMILDTWEDNHSRHRGDARQIGNSRTAGSGGVDCMGCYIGNKCFF